MLTLFLCYSFTSKYVYAVLCYFSRANVSTLFIVLSRANTFALFYVIFSRANVFALILSWFALFFGTFTSEYVYAVLCYFSQANVFTLFVVPSRANMSTVFVIFLERMCLRCLWYFHERIC